MCSIHQIIGYIPEEQPSVGRVGRGGGGRGRAAAGAAVGRVRPAVAWQQ